MIESATLITFCMLYLIFFRPGKTPPLEKSLVIERVGQYHLTLAPQLNLAQPFIEALAAHLGSAVASEQNSETQFFTVRDKQVAAHGFEFYLLAITQRNGMWLFQAARPLAKDDAEQLPVISEFAHDVLARFLLDEAPTIACGEEIVAAAQQVASLRGIQIKTL
jgi:hypothetical protein